MDCLVKHLSEGSHSLELEPRLNDLAEIKKRLDKGYALIKFIKTIGGTELSINIDRNLTCLTEADFEMERGRLVLVGTCELNWEPVRCRAEIELATRIGIGYLETLEHLQDKK